MESDHSDAQSTDKNAETVKKINSTAQGTHYIHSTLYPGDPITIYVSSTMTLKTRLLNLLKKETDITSLKVWISYGEKESASQLI